jgi:hypothetical protein
MSRTRLSCFPAGPGRTAAIWRRAAVPVAMLPKAVCLAFLFTQSPLFALRSCAAGDEPIPALRPPRGEMLPTFWEQHGFWLVLLAVVALAAVALAGWYFFRPRPPLPPSPFEQARRALEPLRDRPEEADLLGQVGRIVRACVVEAFGLPPDESTTEELSRALAAHEKPGAELAAALTEYLRESDRHKFAPGASSPSMDAVARGLDLVRRMEARLAALAQPGQPTA